MEIARYSKEGDLAILHTEIDGPLVAELCRQLREEIASELADMVEERDLWIAAYQRADKRGARCMEFSDRLAEVAGQLHDIIAETKFYQKGMYIALQSLTDQASMIELLHTQLATQRWTEKLQNLVNAMQNEAVSKL